MSSISTDILPKQLLGLRPLVALTGAELSASCVSADSSIQNPSHGRSRAAYLRPSFLLLSHCHLVRTPIGVIRPHPILLPALSASSPSPQT